MKDTAHLKGFGRLSTILIGYGYKPGAAWRFQAFVDSLIANRGLAGALAYLDSFGNSLANEFLGLTLPTPVWVDPYRHLDRHSLRGRKELMLRLTKIKRALVASNVRPEQWEKFHKAVTRAKPTLDSLSGATFYLKEGARSLVRYAPRMPGPSDVKSCFPLYVRKALSQQEDLASAYTAAWTRFMKDLAHLAEHDRVYDSLYILKALHPLDVYELRTLVSYAQQVYPAGTQYHVGHVCGTQEPGVKLRCFASPRLIYQAATTPLYEWSFGLLSNLPEDSVYDQFGHIPRLQELLEHRETLYAFDLTNATDSIPWGTVSYTLAQLGVPSNIISLCYEISRGQWNCVGELSDFSETIAWTEGWPLGLKPAFGFLALMHHALVRGICTVFGRTDWPYTILGDDIVIWDGRVAAEYEAAMTAMGVEISRQKSMVSRSVTEFAGTLVTRDFAIRPGKWRCATPDNLLSFLTQPAFDFRKVVPKFWVKLIERLQCTPVPFGFHRPCLDDMSPWDRRDLALRVCEAMVPVDPKEAVYCDTDFTIGLLRQNRVWEQIYSDRWPINCYSSYVNGDIPCFLQVHHLEEVWRAKEQRRSAFEAQLAWNRLHGEGPGKYSQLVEGWQPPNGPWLVYIGQPTTKGGLDGVPAGYTRVYGLFRQIIYSILVLDRSVDEWFALLPALRQAASTRRQPLDRWDLCALVAKSLPVYQEHQFRLVPSRFIQMLRRISDKKDLVPSYLAPMPVLTKNRVR